MTQKKKNPQARDHRRRRPLRQKAIAAGWEPLSRGKTVDIVVDRTGG